MKNRFYKNSFLLSLIIFAILCLFALIVVLANKKLKVSSTTNYTIFIDPGHGGKDNGASYNDIFEDELNLKYSKILYERLICEGYNTYITRISDYDLSSTYAKNHKIEDLNKRIEYINNSKCDLFISLHLNYYYSSNVNGLQVFYQSNILESKIFAQIMQDNINELNKKPKKTKSGDYYLLNHTNRTGILLEFGFLSSEYDRNRLLNERFENKLISKIINGIEVYLIEKDQKI